MLMIMGILGGSRVWMPCEVNIVFWNTFRILKTVFNLSKCIRRERIFEWPGGVTVSKGQPSIIIILLPYEGKRVFGSEAWPLGRTTDRFAG
jgi:hypothetical protein